MALASTFANRRTAFFLQEDINLVHERWRQIGPCPGQDPIAFRGSGGKPVTRTHAGEFLDLPFSLGVRPFPQQRRYDGILRHKTKPLVPPGVEYGGRMRRYAGPASHRQQPFREKPSTGLQYDRTEVAAGEPQWLRYAEYHTVGPP